MTLFARILFAAALLIVTPVTATYAADAKLDAVQHDSVSKSVEEGTTPENGDVSPEHKEAEHGAEAAEGEGHAKKAGLPQFDPSSFAGQIFWLVIAFAIMYFVFSRKTLPEISSVLESRHQHIQSDLDTAESLRREAEEVHQAYEKALNKARTEATDLYIQVEKNAKDKTAEAMRAFYDRSMKNVGATEKRIEAAKAGAMEDMNSIAADIARQAAEKIVGVATDLNEAKTVVTSIQKRKAA